jgi:hypothetical protein
MNTWPKIHFPSATEIVEPRDLGYGVQYYVLSHVSKFDYEEYKEYLRREGLSGR